MYCTSSLPMSILRCRFEFLLVLPLHHCLNVSQFGWKKKRTKKKKGKEEKKRAPSPFVLLLGGRRLLSPKDPKRPAEPCKSRGKGPTLSYFSWLPLSQRFILILSLHPSTTTTGTSILPPRHSTTVPGTGSLNWS